MIEKAYIVWKRWLVDKWNMKANSAECSETSEEGIGESIYHLRECIYCHEQNVARDEC